MDETNPVVLRLLRAGELESLHRGVWALVDSTGSVIDGAGDPEQLIYPRSATKSLQALPLIESGAFDRYGFDDRHLALAIASHSGEPEHEEIAADGLEKIGLDEDALRCGPQRPFGAASDADARRITNNCSGKHVGFLAVVRHLGDEPAHYLDRSSRIQKLVVDAMVEMTDIPAGDLGTAIDGCSAPTFRLPVRNLALGLARLTNPDDLAPARAEACRRITAAARAHPQLVAGHHERFCTDLIRATDGRVFGKIGAEGVYSFGIVGGDLGFACKIDDGAARGLYPLVIDVLRRHELISADEVEALDFWGTPILRNWSGLEIGHVVVGSDT